jgi:hypothetical protein
MEQLKKTFERRPSVSDSEAYLLDRVVRLEREVVSSQASLRVAHFDEIIQRLHL